MKESKPATSVYRVHFVGSAAAIYETQQISAEVDAKAIAEAERMFRERPKATGFTLIAPGARAVASRRR